MKKYSALLLCIILAIQPLTSSFDQAAQPNSEPILPEETAEKQFSNHAGECGNNSSLTDMWIWPDATTYTVGDTVTGTWHINCTVIGADYNLTAYVWSVTYGAVSWTDTWNWTAQHNHKTFTESFSSGGASMTPAGALLGVAGHYCLNGTAWDSSGNNYAESEFSCFTVVNGTSGGGGSGSNTDCGNNSSLTDLMVYTDATIYNVGDTVTGIFYVNCTVIGSNYTLEYDLFDGSYNSVIPGYSGSTQWTATTSWESHSVSWTTLLEGVYCLFGNLTIGSAGTPVDDDDACFEVVNGTSGGGGNNGGNNNTGCGNWTNLTSLFVWADSASFEVGDDVTGNFFMNCTVIGQYYELDYEVIGPFGSGPAPIYDSGTIMFTASQNSEWATPGWWDNGAMPAGDYCIDGYLHTGAGTPLIAQDSDCFTLENGTDPGGNNTGNTSDCGSEHNMTQLWATQYSSVPYYVWQTINTAWVVQCAVIGEEYMLHAALEDDPSTSAMPLQTYWDDWTTFTAATPTVNAGNAQFWWLNPGDYCVDSTLYLGNTIVDNVYECFTVIDDPNWNNNNNNTNNNSGNSSTDPILPNNSTGNNSGNNTGNNTSFNFTFDVNWGQPTFIDPYVAIGYDYEISEGPNFASVQIPYNYGDGMYDIYLWDGTDYVYSGFSIATGTTYQFQSGGVDRFSIRGIEVSAELNPDDPEAFVTGLTFVNSGAVDMAMIPLTVFVDEPEPECVGDCPELISGDADGDGVPNEWDDCPDTTEGAATDTNGCEVITVIEPTEDNETETTEEEDDDDDESGGGIPGFTAMLAISAVIGALIFTNRRIQKRLD